MKILPFLCSIALLTPACNKVDPKVASFKTEHLVINYNNYGKRVAENDWIQIDDYVFKHTSDPHNYSTELQLNDTTFIPSVQEKVFTDTGELILTTKRSGMYISTSILKHLLPLQKNGLTVYGSDKSFSMLGKFSLRRTDGKDIKVRHNLEYHAEIQQYN